MAEWIGVYCRREVALDAEAMRRELDAADLWTLGDALDVPEDELDAAVTSALRNLRVEPASGCRASIEVHWKPGGRPIQITSVTGAAAIAQITETLEETAPLATGPGAVRVREHLSQCRQVVNFEMAADDARHLGATLGGVLAFFVAEAGDGLVWFFDQDWASPDNRTATIWTTSHPAAPDPPAS